MNLDILDKNAKKIGEIQVSDTYKSQVVNQKVISQYVYTYLSNQREGNAHTKDRSEVSGGGKKPWKQKGTGRARVGSSRSPIWTKGGITFGPRNTVNYKRKTTKNFRKSAFQNVMAYLIQSENVKVINTKDIVESDKLTKSAVEFLKAINNPKKVTIILSQSSEDIVRAFSNIKNINVVNIGKVNPYLLLNGGVIIFEDEALKLFEVNWGVVEVVKEK